MPNGPLKDLAWEKKYGPIPPGKKVNHRDGIRQANQRSNLVLVDEDDYEGDDDQEFIWVNE